MGNATNEENWASRERLRVIERALWWRGWVRRSDITSMFGISAAQVSGDLQRYLELNPGAMAYHTSRKRYEAVPGSKWVIAEPNFEEALSIFFDGGVRVFPAHAGDSVHVAGVGLPARIGKPEVTRCLTMAALSKMAVDIEYLSVSSGTGIWRGIDPHAFGHDGYRWHVRARCQKNGDYRDFVLSRIKDIKWPSKLSKSLLVDHDWYNIETLELRPHSDLDEGARRAIEYDYGIPEGTTLKIPVRKAMRGYLESHLRVFNEGNFPFFEAAN